MTSLLAAFRRIGGPDAVTWPAFWVSLLANFIGQFTVAAPSGATAIVRVIAVGASQLAMFTPLIVLRLTVLRRPSRPLPWVTVVGFAIAVVVRAVVLAAVLDSATGAPESTWDQRLIASFVNLFLVLLITALVVSTIRDHTRSLSRLSQMRSDLEATATRVRELVEQRNEDAARRAMTTLEEAIDELEGAEDADAVQSLQRLASDVVRPMSHDLAMSVPRWALEELPPTNVRITWRDVASALGRHGPSLPSAPGPFLPMLTGLTMVAVLFGGVSLIMPHLRWQILLIAFGGSAFGLTCANAVLRRFLPRRTLMRSLALVVSTSMAAAGIPALIVAFLVGGEPGIFLGVGGTIFIATISLMAAVISTVLREQQRTEFELAEATARLRTSVVRLNQVQWFQHKSLSRALHGPVQSAATAAALRLDAAVRSGSASPHLVRDVVTTLRREINVLEEPVQQPLPIESLSARLVGTWSGVCDVTTSWSHEAVAILDADSVLRSAVTETMTEAVSNAVRHGRASAVTLHLTVPQEDRLLLQVIDNGRSGTSSAPAGLGSQLLDECTLNWELTTLETGSRLDAVFPVAST